LFEAYTTYETTGGHQDPINNLQGQRRQPPGGWSSDDPGAILRVKFRIVTWALERLSLSLPQPYITALMRTDRRVRHDPLWRVRAGSLGEIRRIEMNEEYLVET
jgi:hypothetical protein